MPKPVEQQIRENIDWLWHQTDLCWKLKCIFYPVEGKFGISFSDGNIGPMLSKYRGLMSGRGCVKSARLEQVNGNRGMAIAWLQAGQYHNAPVQRQFAENADYTLNYLEHKYPIAHKQ